VPLNCAALPRDLAEAELFGHRRGAFTDAGYDRKGLFRSAEGGIVFLDEISELRLEVQAKLLRVLQENRVLTLGEDRESSVNVRIIAATNRNLHERVAQGAFRADLFHRLNVLTISIQPLRERPEDVEALVAHFLRKHRELNPKRSFVAEPEFIEALLNTGLPGNARQVENVVRQALARKDDDSPLGLADLPAELWEEVCARSLPLKRDYETPLNHEAPTPLTEMSFSTWLLRLCEEHAWNLSRSLEHCERLLLEAALHRTRGNQSETARLLGITPRSVYNKLHRRPPRA
jgi:DNA-binding NtrC family response regulator